MNDIRNKPLPSGENGPSNSSLGNSALSSQSTSAVTPAGQSFLGSQSGAGLGSQSNNIVGAAAGARPGGMPTPSLIVSSTSDAVPVSSLHLNLEASATLDPSSSELSLDISY